MVARFRKIIQILCILALVIAFIYWSVKDLSPADKAQISTAIQQANFRMLAAGFASLLLSHFIRSLRWRLLIDTLGYRPSRTNVFFAVLTGYFANQAIPRLGELLKCSTLTRYEKIPFDKLLGTVILERLVDGLSLILLAGIAFLAQPELHHRLAESFDFARHSTEPNRILYGLGLIILIASIVTALGFLIAKHKFLRLFHSGKKIAARIWTGFTAIGRLKKRGLFLIYTLLIWLLYATCVYSGFLTLQETSGFNLLQALTVLCAGSVGMMLTPGGIGAYAFLVQKTMILYDLNAGVGLVLGWLLWLLQTTLIIVMGTLSLISLPIYNNRMTASRKTKAIHEK